MFRRWGILDPVPLQSSTDFHRLAVVQDSALPDFNAACSAVVQIVSTKRNLCHLEVAILEALVQ